MSFTSIALLGVLLIIALAFSWLWFSNARGSGLPDWMRLAVGFVTNFFDTLGVGSFAPTTALFKLRRLVSDELIPGTLNVGHAVPTVVQAFIFITAVAVAPATLIAMIAAAVLGAWLGAGFVTRMSRRAIQFGMGFALAIAATLFILVNLELLPGGGEALQLEGVRLAIGVGTNFVLGALMTLGIGLYGPCLILVSLLGMSPLAAFPIMMGSCAFLMPVAGARFVRTRKFDSRAALGLAIGGIPAVLIAAYLVQSLPMVWLRWLVVIVVLYTAVAMLRSALGAKQVTPASSPARNQI